MENNIYIVTGATSFIGSGLLRKLVAEEKKVYAICRNSSKNIFRLPKSDLITTINCDLSDLSKLEELIPERCDVFYHLGWSTTEKNNTYLQTQNIIYTLDAVNVAKKLGCHTFLGAGSQAEYGLANLPLDEFTHTNPVTGYGAAKLSAGQMSRILCNQLDLKHIWTRILSVYGQDDNQNTLIMYLINSFKQNEPPILTDCEQIWDYIHIDDCSKILYKLPNIGESGRVYVIGSGIERKLKDYVNIVNEAYGNKCSILWSGKQRDSNTPCYLLAKNGYCGNMVENPIEFDVNVIREIGVEKY